MSKSSCKQLTIAVSSRALFDLEKEHDLFERDGYKAYKDYQISHMQDPLLPGVAFPFVKRLLGLNELFEGEEPFQVVVLSRNSPETGQRFFQSCRHYNLPIKAGAFTSGQSTFPFIRAFDVSLFLSANPDSVKKAIEAGLPGGLVLPGKTQDDDEGKTLRIAFDFDGVIADDESEREYQKEGLKAFQALELSKKTTPHSPGPLQHLFQQLSEFQRLDYKMRGVNNPYFEPAIRISIVTARGAPSEGRLITTLKSFGMSVAELFLLDGIEKRRILEAIRPHIFFDDQVRHLETMAGVIPSVLVPFGINNLPEKDTEQ